MSIFSNYGWPVFAASILIVMPGFFSVENSGESMPLVVERVLVIDSLEEVEARGVTLHIEQYGEGNSFATVRVCKRREDLPDDVSASLFVSLEELYEADKTRLLLGFAQQMHLDESSPDYDFGRFQIQSERLEFLSLMLTHSYRDSGEDWEDANGAITLRFRDMVDDLTSKERTYYSSFDEFPCRLPSGIYNYRPPH